VKKTTDVGENRPGKKRLPELSPRPSVPSVFRKFLISRVGGTGVRAG